MTSDTALIEKREELKRRLAAGEYKTLVDVFLEWLDRLIRKLSKRSEPYPHWLITVILSLVLVIFNFGAIYVKSGFTGMSRVGELLGYGLGYGFGLLLISLVGVITFAAAIVINQSIGNIIILWRDNILDATESVSSLQEFEDWIKIVCNRRLHLIVAIFGGLLIVLIAAAVESTLIAEIVSTGFIFGVAVVYMVGTANIYQTLMIIVLTIKLHRYDLKLFTADPASSELISRLSSILAFYLYFVSIVSAVWTLLNGTLVPTLAAGIALVFIIWLPIIAVFVLNQTSLSSIIRRAKWKTLNEIQVKVEKLQSTENFEDKETMDAINRLMDYHDRVKATPNSAINLSTTLGFINSLLLPLLAFLLGNLDLVLKLFSRQP